MFLGRLTRRHIYVTTEVTVALRSRAKLRDALSGKPGRLDMDIP